MTSTADLRALRTLALALLEQIEAMCERAAPAVNPDQTCGHPADQRINVPRMGQPTAWLCRACGVEGETAAAAATKEG